jgi:predicted NBD/HSP70 family sugar kinase
MDPAGLAFAVFLAVFVLLCGYGMSRNLKQDWREMRDLEEDLHLESLERKAERLLERAEAQEGGPDAGRELEARVERLDQARAGYVQRLENLEAVVVGQVWDEADDPERGVRPPERPKVAVRELNRRRTAELARQLDK